ncbi:MAG: hypothetical protein ACRER2_00985 [Methylococcales bacterium]
MGATECGVSVRGYLFDAPSVPAGGKLRWYVQDVLIPLICAMADTGRNDFIDRVHILKRMSHDELIKICAVADLGLKLTNPVSSLGNYVAHPSKITYFLAKGLLVLETVVQALESIIYLYNICLLCVPLTKTRLLHQSMSYVKAAWFFPNVAK